MKNSEHDILCLYCKSSKIIRHGKTSVGNTRYRCLNCKRTWVLEKSTSNKPHISEIVEKYLEGKTYRELVGDFHTSPLRINQKIREFLQGIPSWEEYLDTIFPQHEFKMIYLIGKYFSCSALDTKDNQLFLAMAVDALSSMIIGFEVGIHDNKNVWMLLLDRMNCRNVKAGTFITNGSKHIDDAVLTVCPSSSIRLHYHRVYRDKEINCCLSRFPINIKLINDSIKVYESQNNKRLNNYLEKNCSKSLKDYVLANPEQFSHRLKERLDNINHIRIEGLSDAFQNRFEKFHMLKDDPMPMINGWLSKYMISNLDYGFSRLSLYMQIPVEIDFRGYCCGKKPIPVLLNAEDEQLKSFVIEVAARSLQLPTFYSKCEMKIDRCSLFI